MSKLPYSHTPSTDNSRLPITGSSDRQPSPSLSSNNPFRNRTASPPNSLPQSPAVATFNLPHTAPERPVSRNPFLDQNEKKDQTIVNVRPLSPQEQSSKMSGPASSTKPALTGHAAELFVSRPEPNSDGQREAALIWQRIGQPKPQ